MFQEECEKAISLLTSKLPELKEEMEKRSNEEELPIEDAIETTAPIYKQLLLSFAEEQAIEDALYILGDSLRREVIEIEPYLKVRGCDQLYCRRTCYKVVADVLGWHYLYCSVSGISLV